MALKGRMSRTIMNASFLALNVSLVFYLHFPSQPGSHNSRRVSHAHAPPVIETREQEPGLVQTVYIDGSLSLPVVQQPTDEPNFVSKNAGELTQFASASDYGNIGLLAHNYLSGKSFFRLSIGQEVHLVYDDGTTEEYIVTDILRYRALQPDSPFSSFQNLNDQGEILTAGEMFERAYGGNRHITFQTCIAKFGNASWGRLFIVAEPNPHPEALAIAP